VDIIAEQARQEHSSDIQVIQRAVDRYAHWHLWEEKFGFISVPSSMGHKLMSLLTDGQARELGRHLAETFARDFVRYAFKTPNLANVLAAFRYLARPYANLFSLQDSEGLLYQDIFPSLDEGGCYIEMGRVWRA